MPYNFTESITTKNYQIDIDPQACYGYFEHHTLGEERGGGLWFESVNGTLSLIDYDGVACLPTQVISALRHAGHLVDADFE